MKELNQGERLENHALLHYFQLKFYYKSLNFQLKIYLINNNSVSNSPATINNEKIRKIRKITSMSLISFWSLNC